jgi:hypothetical protein
VRYDWNKNGRPVTGLVTRIGMWWMTLCALAACPMFLWEAATRDWTLVFPGLLIGGGAILQRIAARKVYGVREEPPSAPEKTHAEAVAEAIEVQRRRQWAAVTGRAYLAAAQLEQPLPAPRSAWDVSTTLDRLSAWNEVCHYEDATGKPDGIATGVIRVTPRTVRRSALTPGKPVVISWTVATRAASHGEGIDLLKVAEPLLRERLAELAHAGRGARFFRVKGGVLAEVLGCLAPPEAEAGGFAVPPGTVTVPCKTSGMGSVADAAVGMARPTAALGSCAHPDAEPVNLLVTGETVAWVCPDCPAELPAGWR